MPISNRAVLLGPWGGEDGAEWNYTANGAISLISITSDDHAIRSISFISGNGDGKSDQSPVFGTPTGTPKEISIDPLVDKLVLMEGIVRTDNHIERVTQLSFTTSKNGVTTKHGPYGSQQKGTEFSCLLSKDRFVGFYGRCGELLNSIGVMVGSGELFHQSWGGEGGDLWSYTTEGTISHIYISYGDVIDAIRFTSVDSSGHVEHSETYGDSDPKLKFHEIKVDTAVEKLNGIMGTYGSYGNMTLIKSLAFTTNNKKTFGTFGTRTGIRFGYKSKNDDEVICGFYGRAGSLIDAIGVYTRPSRQNTNGLVVSPVGTSGPVGTGGQIGWEYKPKGVISGITITYHDGPQVYTIAFESKDEAGSIDSSPLFGTKYSNSREAQINIDGKLNGIGGTFGVLADGANYLTSLYFSTDEKIIYGPFGDPDLGTHFSIPVKDGVITGFHGRYTTDRCLINSMGIYVNPT